MMLVLGLTCVELPENCRGKGAGRTTGWTRLARPGTLRRNGATGHIWKNFQSLAPSSVITGRTVGARLLRSTRRSGEIWEGPRKVRSTISSSGPKLKKRKRPKFTSRLSNQGNVEFNEKFRYSSVDS